MTKKGPGKAHRKGLTLLEIAQMFSDEMKAKKWIAKQRWPNGAECPHCGSTNVQCWIKHKSQTHRCRNCPKRPLFSVKTNTVMEDSNLQYRHWAVAVYLFTANIKGISSLKLARELGIGQKAAWFMLQRLRKAYEFQVGLFAGPVEVDETYIGGKRKNMPKSKREKMSGRGTAGKMALVGAKDRETNQVKAQVVQSTDKETLQEFVAEAATPKASVYTDDAAAYRNMPFNHESVNHSAGEYVLGRIHTNSVESFWAMFKRAHKGTYHKMSPKHLQRYVDEFVGRHNVRDDDTIGQMSSLVNSMKGKRLTYDQLIADNGLNNTSMC